MQSKGEDVRIIDSETLSDNWYNLKKYIFDLQRRDGEWQRQQREVYDRGNGATILLYNREKKTVILTRQFRFLIILLLKALCRPRVKILNLNLGRYACPLLKCKAENLLNFAAYYI